MNTVLVAYFSAGGRTEKFAKDISNQLHTDLYKIQPEVPYSKKDLNWMNSKSRSSVEMNDKSFRPAIIKDNLDISKYDTILLGFPIWWYVAPTIVNTFLEAYDFSNKKIILFATSGSSGFGNTRNELQPSAYHSKIVEGLIVHRLWFKKEIEKLKELF